MISINETVSDISLGKNHMLMLTSSGDIFSLGSNQYGQLGVPNSQLVTSYDH